MRNSLEIFSDLNIYIKYNSYTFPLMHMSEFGKVSSKKQENFQALMIIRYKQRKERSTHKIEMIPSAISLFFLPS